MSTPDHVRQAETAEHVKTRIEWFNAEGKLLDAVVVPGDATAVMYDPDSGSHMLLALEPPPGAARAVSRVVFEKVAPQTVLAVVPEAAVTMSKTKASDRALRTLTDREVSDLRAVHTAGSSRQLLNLVERIIRDRMEGSR